MKLLGKILIVGGIVMAQMASGSVLKAVEARDAAALSAAITAGQSLEERNNKGQTPLLVAVWNDDVASAKALIEAGADVNAKDNIKDSPYLVAGAHGRVEILKMILANGADLKSTNRYGGTALIPAAEKGHPEAVSLLIEAGVDLDHVNDLGWTALLEAVVLSDGGPTHQDIVGRLVAAGADRSIPDRNGVDALTHAKAMKYTEIAKLLEDAR